MDTEAFLEAMKAAVERVHRDRRRMSLDDAEDIFRMEFKRRGLNVPDAAIERNALVFHRGPAWPLLHPVKARREWRRSMVDLQGQAHALDGPPDDGPSIRIPPRRNE